MAAQFIAYRDFVKQVQAAGWTFDRQAKGSHEVWKRGEQSQSVPRVGGRHVKITYLRQMLKPA